MDIKREETAKAEKEKSILEELWVFFSSMKVGIVLLLIVTGMSVYGSLLPHEEAMDRVYRSWWFVGALTLTALNLLICSINRWKGIWEKATIIRDNLNFKTLQSYKNQEFISLTGKENEKAENIRAFLSARGYRTAVASHEKGFLVSADKGRFGYFGSLVTHLSIILLLLAGLYGILGGYESFDGGFPGRVLPVEEEDFQVRIDDFYISYRDDPQRSIEQYYSTLTVIEGGQEVKQEKIYVNKPLRYHGVTFYQSTYGWGVDVELLNTVTGEKQNTLLVPGQTYHLGNTGMHLYLINFYPNFTMTPEGMPTTRGAYPANPYVAYRLTNAQGVIGHPFYVESLNTPIELDEEYILQFTGYRNYTGFLIVKNPGKGLAFLASMLMIVGLIMSFYLFPRRIWAYAGEETEGKVFFAGQSHRNKVGFELEFKKLMQEIKNKWEE